MLPELIYREGKQDNYILLALLGLSSGLLGYIAATVAFPSDVSILAVVFASIPLLYPLTRTFLEDEREDGRPHFEEIRIYGSLFLGEVAAFFLLAILVSPENLSIQVSQYAAQLESLGVSTIGGSSIQAVVTGSAASPSAFLSVLINNLLVFGIILVVSAVISSSGAFILVWNASVLGTFMGFLAKKLSAAHSVVYIPHATLEMLGFIVAGVSGSLISAAVYRKHFERDTWIDYLKLVSLGLGLILLAAVIETA
ncbi:MAG: stage II sporulation protein M [Candidatus Nanohaloarchaea archaeon]